MNDYWEAKPFLSYYSEMDENGKILDPPIVLKKMWRRERNNYAYAGYKPNREEIVVGGLNSVGVDQRWKKAWILSDSKEQVITWIIGIQIGLGMVANAKIPLSDVPRIGWYGDHCSASLDLYFENRKDHAEEADELC